MFSYNYNPHSQCNFINLYWNNWNNLLSLTYKQPIKLYFVTNLCQRFKIGQNKQKAWPLTLGIPDWIHSARILSLSPEKLELSSESSGFSTSLSPLLPGSSTSRTPSKRISDLWTSVSTPSPGSERTERSECDPAWEMLAGVPSVQ